MSCWLYLYVCCCANHRVLILGNLTGSALKVNLLLNLSIFQFLNKLFIKKEQVFILNPGDDV